MWARTNSVQGSIGGTSPYFSRLSPSIGILIIEPGRASFKKALTEFLNQYANIFPITQLKRNQNYNLD